MLCMPVFLAVRWKTILAWDSTSHGGKMAETCEQRCQIYALLQSGHSQAHIARQIGVDPSTISRELVRNTGARNAASTNTLTASSGSTSQKVPTSLFCPMPMSKGSRTNSTLAPERYSATKPLARFSSAPEICPLHFTVEWAQGNRRPKDENRQIRILSRAESHHTVRRLGVLHGRQFKNLSDGL